MAASLLAAEQLILHRKIKLDEGVKLIIKPENNTAAADKAAV